MMADRPWVEAAVIDLAKRKGYRVQQSADAFAGRKIYLHYVSVVGHSDRIEVDLNFLFRLPIDGTALQEIWQPGELDRPAVRVVNLKEVLIGKLLAYLDRCAARDVWDLTHLPEKAKKVLASVQFRAWFIALTAILDHPLTAYTRERLETLLTKRDIAEQLVPMLIGNAQIDPQNLIEYSWAMLSPFMILNENETSYLAGIERGELIPELLFPNDPMEAGRVAMHPALLWKIVNVRIHLARQEKKKKRDPSKFNPL